MKSDDLTGLENAHLASTGEIERFPYIRPGTGKRGRPGKLRLNELPKGDGLVFDEVTGIAYQGANLGLHEVGEFLHQEWAAAAFVGSIAEATADEVAAIERELAEASRSAE